MAKCPFCSEDMVTDSGGETSMIECGQCGKYQVTRTAIAVLDGIKLSETQKANIRGWFKENPDFLVSSDDVKRLTDLKSPTFHEKADKLLAALEKNTPFAGFEIDIEIDGNIIEWISVAWCRNYDELFELLSFLEHECRAALERYTGGAMIKILPHGWAYLEKIKKGNLEKNQCFVAMWFDDDMTPIYYNTIVPGILAAGYKPHRVDQSEHNGKIDDEIIAQIRKSRIVLADFTGHRGGVYYEAGFAKGLNIEVIWSCREDHFDDLHFDIRQYNCISWNEDNLEMLEKRITARIEAVLGHGDYRG